MKIFSQNQWNFLESNVLWPRIIVINLPFKSSSIVLPIRVNDKVEMDDDWNEYYQHHNKAFVNIVLDDLVTLI